MKDPNVRRCSPAARGVWMDMLCLAFECEDRGVLASGGQPWTDAEISAAVTGPTDVVLSCISELLSKGVCGRNKSGAIFSKRMVRDEKERTIWRQRQKKHRDTKEVCHADVTLSSRPSSSSSSSSKTTTTPPLSPPTSGGTRQRRLTEAQREALVGSGPELPPGARYIRKVSAQ